MLFFRLLLLFLVLYLLYKVASSILISLFRSREKREGDVHINHQQKGRKKIINQEDGEYVKFEEIKEEK